MNLSCLYTSVVIFTSAGRVADMSSRALSIFSVRASVLVSGCFVTVIMTHGFPLSDATPVFGVLSPIFTSAISPSVRGIAPDGLTTAFAISLMSPVAAMPRMIYSLAYS